MEMRNPLANLEKADREKLVEILQRTANQFQFSEPDLLFMFKCWDKIFPYDEQKITCGACRTYVVSRLRTYERSRTVDTM